MSQYLATINVPGYLPMDDEPPVFDSARDAWQYLADEREFGMDEYDLGDDDVWHYLIAQVEEPSGDGTGWAHGGTPGYGGSHDLGLNYSVTNV